MKRPELTLGVEEEYQVVDPESRELQSVISHFTNRNEATIYHRTISSELHQSMVELGTGVCRTPDEVMQELKSQREYIRDWRPSGPADCGRSTHPVSRWEEQEFPPTTGIRRDLDIQNRGPRHAGLVHASPLRPATRPSLGT